MGPYQNHPISPPNARTYPFAQVDVFTNEAFRGNPLAVVFDADDWSDTQMQAFAAWTNLSETVFIKRPINSTADYRLRIFAPTIELPFAGHPTLGAAHAFAERTGSTADALRQECGAGIVEVRRAPLLGDDPRSSTWEFAAPPLVRSGGLSDAELNTVVAALGVAKEDVLAHQWVDNGPGWACIELGSAVQVASLNPDYRALDGMKVGVIARLDGGLHEYVVRGFSIGREDPVTGSLNAGIALWLHREGRVSGRYTATQGEQVGRRGVVTVRCPDHGDEHLWIGGAVTTRMRGEVG